MKKIATLVILPFLIINSWAQSSPNSLSGTYLFTQEIGGGFTGGPNGECMVLHPDGHIINKLIIDSDLNVFKISDTNVYNSISLDWNCDTLSIGSGRIVKDSLIVSFSKKPHCSMSFFEIKTSEAMGYEIFPSPIIERYQIQFFEGRLYGLNRYHDGWEEYRKDNYEDEL